MLIRSSHLDGWYGAESRLSYPASAQNLLEKLTDRVTDENVTLLDARGGPGRNAQTEIAQSAHLAAVGTRQSDDRHSFVARGLDRLQHVLAVAARRQRHENIALAAVGTDFTREHLVVAIVVADRGQRRRIRVKGQGRERFGVAEESSGELGDDVLRIGCRAAVAAHEQAPARGHRFSDHVDDAVDVGRQGPRGRRDSQVLVPHRLDRQAVAHWRLHVRTPIFGFEIPLAIWRSRAFFTHARRLPPVKWTARILAAAAAAMSL